MQSPLDPTPAHRERPLSLMLQGPGTNLLAQVSSRHTPGRKTRAGDWLIVRGNLHVLLRAQAASAPRLRASTHKLLDACIIAFTAQNRYRDPAQLDLQVQLSIRDYRERCGQSATRDSRRHFKALLQENLATLDQLLFEWDEPRGKQTEAFGPLRICSLATLDKGDIKVSFSPELAQYLVNSYLTYYPLGLLRQDDRNPHAYYLGRKLCVHYGMARNRLRQTHNVISVKALLPCLPALPSPTELLKGGHSPIQRIIRPLEAALNALCPTVLTHWGYCDGLRAPLKVGELAKFNYDVFSQCYIRFEIQGAPDFSPRKKQPRGRKGKPTWRTKRKRG